MGAARSAGEHQLKPPHRGPVQPASSGCAHSLCAPGTAASLSSCSALLIALQQHPDASRRLSLHDARLSAAHLPSYFMLYILPAQALRRAVSPGCCSAFPGQRKEQIWVLAWWVCVLRGPPVCRPVVQCDADQ